MFKEGLVILGGKKKKIQLFHIEEDHMFFVRLTLKILFVGKAN